MVLMRLHECIRIQQRMLSYDVVFDWLQVVMAGTLAGSARVPAITTVALSNKGYIIYT